MNTTMKVIVIDDEILARKRVINLLKEVKEIDLIGECQSGKEAIDAIENKKPDLIFLDIQMKDMTGFDVLRQIHSSIRPLVIFITAFDKFALKAFECFAFDYLMKPFKDERFFQSTNEAIDLFFLNQPSETDKKINALVKYIEDSNTNFIEFKNTKLSIKTNGKILFIEKVDIKYIKASGYYAEIFTDQKKYLLRGSLNSLIHQLKPFNFFRIHRSTIINISYIKELIYSNYSEIDVKMSDEKLFRISKTYRKAFQKKIGVI